MHKAIIKKNNVETNSAIFETQEMAQGWIDSVSLSGAFGKNERWLTESEAVSQGDDIADSVAQRQLEIPGRSVTQYRFLAEYTQEILDVTNEVLKADKIKLRVKKQDIGSIMIAEITELNAGKSLTPEALAAYLSDTSALNVERLLRSGSLEYAKAAIQAFPGSFYTLAEKQALIARLDSLVLGL